MLWLSQVRSKRMTPGGIAFAGGAAAIGKFLAVIGQDLLHREGACARSRWKKAAALAAVFSPSIATYTPREARSMPTNS